MIHGLDRARWAVLSPYLDQALEMPSAARTAWLEGLRAGDRALADEVGALLAAYDRLEVEEFLEAPPAPRATLAGLTLGAYTLRDPIGRGGMGSVWLADRSDGRYEGVAAVKLLNASLMGRDAETRFRREGSILARLRHRHIAQLIDAGLSPAGQPFLVLEYVDGEHLDTYCDRRRLPVRERVRLFVDVLAAVSHAHANLIVHRDLKPSNVLVDRDGTVKLLDFGVAKLLTPDAVGATLTREGGGALTPEYAAPEQLMGGDITTATDVYALGVLLYVLLTGCHPARPAQPASPADLIRAILDRDPVRLSSADTTETSPSVGASSRAATRDTTPEGLRRVLRGDLETIVGKAIKKDPSERYSSVVAMADDLRRYLDHAPIGARPDTLGYRAGKFLRRHRLPVSLAGVLLAALAAGVAGTIWQARAAARERDRALAQLDRAESINQFTTFLLGEGVPSGQSARVGDVLARGERLAVRRSEDDPDLAVDLLVTIGTIYESQEDRESGQRALKRAYDLAQEVANPATKAGATCTWARVVAEEGDFPGALRLIDQGLALTSEDQRFDGVAAACLLHRGSIAMHGDSPDVVVASAQEALRRLSRGSRFPDLRASALHLVAIGHRLAGRTAEADRTFALAFEQFRRLGREDATEGTALMHNWAMNTAATSPLEALERYRRIVRIYDGSAEGGARLASLHNFAHQLLRLGRPSEARPVLERVQSLARQRGSAQALVFNAPELARACRELGDLACARASLRAAQDRLPVAPPGHGVRGDLAREQGLLAEAERRDEDVRPLLLEALAIHRGAQKPSLDLIETLLELSRLELRLGSAADAEVRAREALAIAEVFRGGTTHSAWVGRSLLALGAARQARGDDAGAGELLAQAIAHMTPTLGASHPAVADARRRLGH